MAKSEKRAYQSQIRQRRADETRLQIADAARKLFLANGYEGTTIDAIAAEAGVASQTVYAVFGSKKGILTEIIERARFGTVFQELVRQTLDTTDPVERLRMVARIARQVYDSEQVEVALLRGAGVVAPELAKLGQERETLRFKAQKPTIRILIESGKLRDDLKEGKARDILWTLTGRETYYMLVVERGWKSSEYESWLADLLTASLLKRK
jgi:AcrR family transcriptional regulator